MKPLLCLLSCAWFAGLAQTHESDKTFDPDIDPICKVEAGYTPEARAAKLQGSVYLYAEVIPWGTPENVRVMHGLGLGLDEKAVEAVRQWRYKQGRPNTVPQAIEVAFQLADGGPWRLRQTAYTVYQDPRTAENRSKPVLSRYTNPDPAACPADGGTVVVELAIDEDGRPRNIKPRHLGDPMSEAAAAAIESWRFQPALANGKPRDAIASIEFECARSSFADSAAPAHPSGDDSPWPELIYSTGPEHPRLAAGFFGEVKFKMVIDPAGHPTRLRVVAMQGMGMDEAALEAASQSRFKPATKDGKPVSSSGVEGGTSFGPR